MIQVTITRETSKYNKYFKWHVVSVHPLVKRSEWFKTQREALEFKAKQEEEFK